MVQSSALNGRKHHGPGSPRLRHHDRGGTPSRRCCRSMTACMRCSRRFPHLSRSSLHRCLQRHGISRLPQVEGDKPSHKRFKSHPIGYFHIDIAEVRSAEGKLHLFVAIDRTSKFAFVRLQASATVEAATAFVPEPIDSLPYRIHTVLTDNGIQFGDLPSRRNGLTARLRMHVFNRVCAANGIEHRTTQPDHPWTNGPSRAHEPNHQGSHRQAPPLRQPRPAATTPARVH